MSAGKYNIEIHQGVDYTQVVTIKTKADGTPIDFTGATIRGQIRETAASTVVIASFTVVNEDLANGTFVLNIPSATTTTLSFTTAVYDVEVQYPNGSVDRLLQGRAVFSPEVTR